MNSPSSGRGQEEPRTPALALPEAAKLWARPRGLAASSRFASGTGQVAGMWGGGSGQLPSSHLGASEWGPGGGGDGSWAPLNPATPPSSPGGGALATPLGILDLSPPSPLEWAGALCLTSATNWGIWIQRRCGCASHHLLLPSPLPAPPTLSEGGRPGGLRARLARGNTHNDPVVVHRGVESPNSGAGLPGSEYPPSTAM